MTSATGSINRARHRRQSIPTRIAGWFAGLLVAVFVLFPFYWVVTVSFTPQEGGTAVPSGLIPHGLTLNNYSSLFGELAFGHYFINSLIIALSTTGVSLLLATPASYAFVRISFIGRRVLSMGILALYMLPPIVLIVPLLVIFDHLRLYNSYQGLVIADTAVGVPFATWILIGFFSTVPKEIEEAALADGCGRFGALVRVLVPLAVPGIIAAGVIVFIVSWNEFLFAFTLTSGDRVKTIQVAMRSFIQGESGVFWGSIMASTVLTSLPVVALFLIFQRRLVGGLSAGSVKG